MNKEFNRPLREGTLGSKMVAYFENNNEAPPIHAERLEHIDKDASTYRMTFEDGSVADYKVTFEPEGFLIIASIEHFNQVI